MSTEVHPKRKTQSWLRSTGPIGASPGTLVVDPAAALPAMHLIAYGAKELEEKELVDIAQVQDYLHKWPVSWVNVDGLGDVSTIRDIGQTFGLNELALEDVMNASERAKVEQYGKLLFIVAHMVSLKNNDLQTEQLNIFMGAQFVLTLQATQPGDCLNPVRNRIRKGLDHLRDAGASYLVYALLDAVVDAYFPILEQFGERLEDLEDAIILNPDRETIAKLHEIKRDLLTMRRAIWPLRDALNVLFHDAPEFDRESLRDYLRDCYDHAVRVIDLIEIYRELCSDLMDVYLSSISNRTNEVMKVLTIISTIFMPLTFIAGVYGMNFDPDTSPLNMPELRWYWGYPFALSLMAVVVLLMLLYFRRRNWF